MISPLVGGDCSGMSLVDAMHRAQVLDVALQDALYEYMRDMKPLPAVFDLDFVAENQKERADNILSVQHKWDAVEKLRSDIRTFKKVNELDKVIVLWTANTERFSDHTKGVHDTADNLLAAVSATRRKLRHPHSTQWLPYWRVAVTLTVRPRTHCAQALLTLHVDMVFLLEGNDFKSGQTKIKSALVEFFVRLVSSQSALRATITLETTTGITWLRRSSSAQRRLQRAVWWMTWWRRINCSILLAARDLTTVLSSSTCHTWATASVPWMSTRFLYLWVGHKRWCCTTRVKTLYWQRRLLLILWS
ncbi:putative inositol-3-phosphate synthase [Trypanosoma cruzi]|uniref:Putative inositol-3-phosphate synthase n=1 Tax=Trypanosoma cruzi TaxID=5693 RepID=A0A2V2ULN9_TRYCR|nr:putative inositol-3-phosphate synthase [Trypanosoma cruzi]